MIIMTISLSALYPSVSFVFFFILGVDFGSHFMQFTSTAMVKSDSHKGGDMAHHPVTRAFYTNKTLFAATCVGAESALVFLYITAQVPSLKHNILWMIMTIAASVMLAFKQLVHIFQWKGASDLIMHAELEKKLKQNEANKK